MYGLDQNMLPPSDISASPTNISATSSATLVSALASATPEDQHRVNYLRF